MTLKIGSLVYNQGESIVPGDVMRDMNLETMVDAYKLLEEIKKNKKIETIYIYICSKCDTKTIYETINSMPEKCEYCGHREDIFGESFVSYIVL